MQKKLAAIVLVVFFSCPLWAWAGPKIDIQVSAQKEVKIVQDGKIVTQRVKAETVEPGDVIFYTLTYENKGNEKATHVVVNNPIPKGTVYLPGSAYGQGSRILFSIDQGKTYGPPAALRESYTLHDGKKITRQAYPSEYTHIRWVIGEVAQGAGGVLGFKVSVK